ncbi:hypothetical protein P7D22_22740, partial [Lichenihabitans sp. Uapishka_5]|uniref:hypothetical protein n=1 Tax=Lichenihabitans sp. Uapishka_5 TaxID=3037302 RepID=UPI0029E811A0
MNRILALAGILATLAGPAMAAATLLPANGLSGTCAGSEVSAPFTATANSVFNLSAKFATGAAGKVGLTMSTDGGQTFAPISINQQILSTISATDRQTASNIVGVDSRLVYAQDATSQFRVECALTSGTAAYSSSPGIGLGVSSIFTLNHPVTDYVRFRDVIAYTTAQAQTLYQAKFTPISAADLASMKTGYRLAIVFTPGANNALVPNIAYVTLSLDPSTPRALARDFRLVHRLRQMIQGEFGPDRV